MRNLSTALLLTLAVGLPVGGWGQIYPPAWTDDNCTTVGESWFNALSGDRFLCMTPTRSGGNCLGTHYPQTCNPRGKGLVVCEPAYVGLDPNCTTAKPTHQTFTVCGVVIGGKCMEQAMGEKK